MCKYGWLWRVLKISFVFVIAGVWGCSQSGSSGCSCAKPIPGGFPDQYKIKNVAQAGITRNAFDFLEKNHQLLINRFLPNGLNFDIPYSKSSSAEICLNPPCKVTGKINQLKFNLIPTQTIRTNLWADISSTKIKVKVSYGVSVTCDVEAQIKNKPIQTDIKLSIDSRTQQLNFEVGTPTFSLENSDFKISGNVLCSIVDLMKGLFKGMIEQEIKKELEEAVADINCMKCKQNTDCPQGATCSKEKCMQGNKCLPISMGMEGSIDIADAMGSIANKQASELWFATHVGGRAEVKTTAVELGTLGGTHAQPSPCVKPHKLPPLPPVPIFPFPVLASDGRPYMVGVGISHIMLTQAMRDFYHTGALCIRIDSSISDQMPNIFTAKGVGAIVAGSILTLVGKDDPPIYIVMRPSEVPFIDIGKGTTMKDPSGKTVIKDPLLELNIPKLQFDFIMMLHDRWIRLFTFQVDVVLPLGLEVLPGNKLGLILGDLSKSMQNPQVINSNILKEEPKTMANRLRDLLQGLMPLVTQSMGNQEFDLPELEGFQIIVRGITGQMPRADKPNYFQFLTLFADLAIAPPSKPQLPEYTIGLRLIELDMPPDFRSRLRQYQALRQYPIAVIEIEDSRPDREYSVRLNGGIWEPYSVARRRYIQNPLFVFAGPHTLEVRSRSISQPQMLEYASGYLKFRVE